MNEETIKKLKTAGKVAAWILIPGGLAWAAWEIYKRYNKPKAGDTTVKQAPPKYQGVKSGNELLNQNNSVGPTLSNP